MSGPKINLERELKRGYLMFKAFEDALFVVKELKGIEDKISKGEAEITRLEQDTKKAQQSYDTQIAELKMKYDEREVQEKARIGTATHDAAKLKIKF